MSKWTFGIAVLALSLAPLAHASDEIKIGTVDMQKALQSVDAGKKAKAQLEREFNSKKKELQDEESSLRKMTEEFKKQSLVMNDEARAKKQGEIQERIMRYQEKTQKSQQEIQAKERELTDPILNKLRDIIQDMAKKRGYSVVLEKNENMVLFSQEKDDMTSEVVAAYNKGRKFKLSAIPFSVSDVLSWTGGRLANESRLGRAVGDIRLTGVSGLAVSKPENVAFFFSKAYQDEIPAARAGVLITGALFVAPIEKSGFPLWRNTAVIVCKDPYQAMAQVCSKFAELQLTVAHIRPDREPLEVHPTAVIHPSVKLGRGVRVGAHVVIEEGSRIGAGTILYPNCFLGPGCRVGEACVLFPNVVLYEWTQIGNRVRLHSGVVIGADGFGYVPRSENGRLVEHEKIYHLGKVVIGDDVEVGASSTIDRGTVADTRVDRGAKIDNNVQIGHNCHVGEGAVLCGVVGMAGSLSVGKFVYLGGFAGVGNQVTVGDGARVGPGTLVGKDVPPGKSVIGYPHRDPKEFFRMHALFNRMLKESKG